MTKPTKQSATGPTKKPSRDTAARRGTKLAAPPAIHEDTREAVMQATMAYGRLETKTEDVIAVVRKTYETAGGHAAAMTLKSFEVSRANVDASRAFFKDFFGAKNPARAIEVQTAFAKAQFATFIGQVKDFQQGMQRATDGIAHSVQSAWQKPSHA